MCEVWVCVCAPAERAPRGPSAAARGRRRVLGRVLHTHRHTVQVTPHTDTPHTDRRGQSSQDTAKVGRGHSAHRMARTVSSLLSRICVGPLICRMSQLHGVTHLILYTFLVLAAL